MNIGVGEIPRRRGYNSEKNKSSKSNDDDRQTILSRERGKMYIDPGSKGFLVLFVVVVIGTIGFFISTMFFDLRGDIIVENIAFQNSNFHVEIKQVKSDKSYRIEIYRDSTWLQDIVIGNDFGDKKVEVTELDNMEFKIGTGSSSEIYFSVDVDEENFASLNVKRHLNREDRVQNCIYFHEGDNFYGGPQQMDQRYPIQKFEFTDYAYITKELHSAAIMERYWFSTSSFFILVDYATPLFIDQDEEKICFTAKKELPYDTYLDTFTFNYKIGMSKSIKETHLNVVNRYLGKPSRLPNERLIRHPIWNTWVNYQRPINETLVEEYAQNIVDNDFGHSLLDIDDFWEDCYGSTIVNTTNFGNLRDLTTKLKSQGFIVGMWVHPFINKNCQPYYDFAKANDYLVKSHSGSTDTSWWNSEKDMAAHINFADQKALQWFRNKLIDIQNHFGIDTFKFDAGETTWYPEDPQFNYDQEKSPSQITQAWVRMASDFGDELEVRTGWGTQNLHILVRMLDFDSRWGVDNGLKSLIPTLFQFNFNGYVFVLPDMIGGNQYGDDVITKELFIRWLEASVFMPALQFSWAPWRFDQETIDITKKFIKLHEDYSGYILERMQLAVNVGEPINTPIWWLDEEDKEAQVIDDEYLLGDKILAAPVITEGATSRSIYLPKGKWRDGNNANNVYDGPMTIESYSAPLGVLPYFIREE